ncbi:MAG: beta-lactamase family protein [Lewinellaceae bacterium]|nr:beta-lactamase family protein [Lewinellaceae bacterium]
MKHTLISLLLSAVLFACRESPPSSSTFTAELDALFQSALPPGEPGGTVLILKGDSILFSKGYGLANLETGEKITPNTLFNTGSISKTFVAYGILKLRDAGALSLEDSLSRYFPDFDHPEIAGKVRIKHLLTHTSGLPDLRRVDEDSVFYLTAKDEENWNPIKRARALNFEPGEKFQYSNPAFNGLALIIEQVSGRKWQDYIREEIFLPAGMANSTITDGQHPQAGVAHAYVKEGEAYREYDYGEYPTFAAAGNGGVWSSAAELAKYELAIRRHAFLPASTVAESRQVYRPENWADSLPPFLGFSWFIRPPAPPRNVQIVEHTGTQGGFYAFHMSIPEKGILYAGLFNQPVDRDAFMEKGLELMEKYGWIRSTPGF